MLNLQGFIEIGPFILNPAGQVAPVGELSEESTSYARNKQYFSKANQQVRLVAFTSERGDTRVVVPAVFTDHILELTQWVYTSAIQGKFKNDEIEFQRLLTGQYQNKITGVVTGAMIANGGNWFPRWIKWKYEVTAGQVENPADVDNEILVWFANDDFMLNYQGCELFVVSPAEPVDLFMGVKSSVEAVLSKWNLPGHHEKARALAEGYPYTAIVSHNYTWHDREDFASTLPTTWSVLVYGRAGFNPAKIKKAYRDWILSHSDYKNVDWAKVFPEIFTSTRFTFVPGWKIRGVPNLEDVAALYYPAIPMDYMTLAIDTFGKWKTEPGKTHESATDVVAWPTLYKSLAHVCIAGEENDDRFKTIQQALPRYALIPINNADISRVDKETSDWLKLFFLAMIAAEDYHPYQTSTDVVKVEDEVHKGIFYWTFEYQNIEYRIVDRRSVWPVTPPKK